jgi:HSP20 family protein
MTMMEPLAPWLRDLNRFMAGDAAPAAFIPPADVLVSDEGVTVQMDVPGLSHEDLDIQLENDTLTIRGERRFPYELREGERVWRHIERRFGRFARTLRVPGGMDPNAVEASLSDGVLSLRIPKPESLKPHRVEVRPGAGSRTDGGDRRDIEGTTGEATGTGGAPAAAGATQSGEATTPAT